MRKIKNIFLSVFLLAITLSTKTVMGQEKPNAPWTGDIHQVALEYNANFSKAQFFVSQTIWLTKNDKPTRVEFVEKGKQKGKTKVIDLRYQITTETKGTVAKTDSMKIFFQKGKDTVAVIVPVIFISFEFGKCKKDRETITVPFVLKPQFTTEGLLINWRKSVCQFEIVPFFSVSGDDFTKKQEGVDYFRVDGKAVAQVDKELIKVLKTAVDKKVQ
jgi:hypothetical protein